MVHILQTVVLKAGLAGMYNRNRGQVGDERRVECEIASLNVLLQIQKGKLFFKQISIKLLR